ncbi:phenylalanine--tRNA ligase subunit beta [Parvularcula sp. ZS-1/3]|uniref:Phenylalanine--tRNA ligase beta subunit n=1 Tax=Parvularcula mediterranea TaxID=2732508 RepID=A0A7Y3W4V8_9PROT|nr:phenylalanine--tRNA ligase subunit beta [Parvularcula mediterranea]NNU15606.1 phenylalanine--tRNA ligase subunit beta [Parvularcula mediterranea]
MKFTLSWLKDHLDTDASLDQIIETMVKVGLEVEEVIDPSEALAPVTVGYVKHAEPHPDADRLRVCKVDTKDGEMQIVCGAPNAREGIRVAYAPVGAYIPGIDVTLSKAKIRGVESFGMMCSSRELELGDDHDGIMELPEAEVGTPLADVVGPLDPVIDFEVTPNRPDTNGVRAIARDLAAEGLGTLKPLEVPEVEASFDQPVTVITEAPDACPAFGALTIRGLKNGPSPEWLQQRLKAIGLRPINMLVDVTNFLSYDAARPLHVYDIKKLNGGVHARMGKVGESFEALNDKEYAVDETMCVIADDENVLGLGGIMGGTSSGCDETTTDVLIESAYFDPLTIAKTGRKLSLTSDARYRFERGIDPASIEDGLKRAAAMILETCGGEASSITIAGTPPVEEKTVSYPPAEVTRLTGMDVPESRQEEILSALGFEVSRGGTWDVKVPTWRPDVEGKADIAEEVARVHGLDNLPTDVLPRLGDAPRRQPALSEIRADAARRACAGIGLMEAVTWAFTDEEGAARFAEQPKEIHLLNPISSDLSVMRPTPLPNLLLAASRNAARGAESVRLFEVGGAYTDNTPKGQRTVATGLLWGAGVRDWQGSTDEPSVFDAKAAALSVLEAIGAPASRLMVFSDPLPGYHPTRSGQLRLGPKNTLARFGELHPSVAKAYDLPGRTAIFEVELDAVPPAKNKGATKPALGLPELMPVRRDFAFLYPAEKPASDLVKAIQGADKALIDDVRLFDVYVGKGVPEGQRSLAIEVVLQPNKETLTDKDIEAVSARIVAAAEKQGGSLRG